MYHNKIIHFYEQLISIHSLLKLLSVELYDLVKNKHEEECNTITYIDSDSLFESILILTEIYLENNILIMSEYTFDETLYNDIYFILSVQLELDRVVDINDDINYDVYIIINNALNYYFSTIVPPRSYECTFIRKGLKNNISKMNDKIEYIKNIPQPPQRTTEWYEFRYNLITASSAWKGLGTQSSINSLIFEKCSPLNVSKYDYVNINSPFHHGTIYEPISILIYEHQYKTKIEDFGCIQDSKHEFMGASPDGINVDPTSPRYGRMLEVKNVVSREITGIPKKEYWIQMQIQMSVCKLNECDFLETKFTEYESEESFNEDGTFNTSLDGKPKGIFIFYVKNGKPYYEYPPVCISHKEYILWENDMIIKNKDLTWNKNIYWKLEVNSCVLVLRNKLWFDYAVKKLESIWDIIVKERVTGFSHRAPKSNKRVRTIITEPKIFNGCCIKID